MTSLTSMFDRPGPRGRRRNAIASVLAAVVLLGLLALACYVFAAGGGFAEKRWIIFVDARVLGLLGSALLTTLKAAVVGGVLALVLGVLLAVARNSRRRWLHRIAGGYVEVTRSLPTLLVLYLAILILPRYGVNLPIYWQLVFALTVTNAAMVAEIVRASLLAVPRGQSEAALALGLTYGRTLRLVLLPQSIRAAMPGLIAQLVYLLKSSTLGYVVSYEELLYTGRTLGEYTGDLLQSFIVMAVIYLVLNLCISQIAIVVERRTAARHGRNARELRNAAE